MKPLARDQAGFRETLPGPQKALGEGEGCVWQVGGGEAATFLSP